MLLLAFLVLIPRWVLGFLIVHWIWKSVDIRDLIIQAFLAGPAGIGISSLISFLWIWAGLDLHVYAVIETIGTLSFLIFILWKRKPDVFEFFKNLRPTISKKDALWLVGLTAGFFIFAGEYWVNALENPHGRWDAWSNWNVVARFVYRGGEHWLGTFLRTPDHPDYPFLLAMSNAISWELLPRETVRGPMVLAFFFAVCLAGLLFSLVNRLRDTAQASLVTIVLITMPFVAYNAMALYADLPEAYYILASAGLIPIYFSNREKPIPILAGFIAGLAAWTKNEGLAFIIISLMLWALAGYLLRAKSALKQFLLGLSFPIVVIILFKAFLAPQNYEFNTQRDVLQLVQDLDRYQLILSRGAVSLWNVGDGPISIIGVLIVYCVMIGKTKFAVRGMPLIALTVLAQLGVYFLIYVISPQELIWHLRTSLSRLYLHVIPLLLLGVFLWLKSPNELLSKSNDQDAYAPHH